MRSADLAAHHAPRGRVGFLAAVASTAFITRSSSCERSIRALAQWRDPRERSEQSDIAGAAHKKLGVLVFELECWRFDVLRDG